MRLVKDSSYAPANTVMLTGGLGGGAVISMREAWQERVPAAALKNIYDFAQLLSGVRHSGGKTPGGQRPREGRSRGRGLPPSPRPPYHYGSSRLGPQGLEHLPLHQEVGQEDDRRDLCDGGNGKGPLWEETRAAGLPLPSGPTGSDSLWASFGCLGAVGRCGSSGEKCPPTPHPHHG